MAQGGLRGWAVLALIAVAACNEPAPRPQPAPPTPSPQPVSPPPAPRPLPPPPAPKDACGAADLQYLVGKPRTDIPIPLQPGRRRVVCSTCMITQDYIPYRQTITYDSGTGLVTSVRCG